MGLNIDEQKAVEQFRKDVVDPSQTKLVILDFWAEWCGPCKALTPVLEKVAAEYADKGVVLAKINVDEQKFIASQFQVQSIPTVYAMFQGQPVADLTPARTESQLKQALDEILSKLPVQAGAADGQPGAEGQQAPDIDQLVAMGEQVLADGDAERAASVFMQLAQMAPDKPEVQSGLIRALVAAGQTEAAQQAYDALPQEMKDDPLVNQAQSALELAGTQVDTGELDTLRKAAAERPADTEAQIAFAEAAFAAGERDEAAETLLRSIQGAQGVEGEEGEAPAKDKLLKMFEAVGMEDPWVSTQRRKLSLILFG
ncbi:tetratricopeptide repeat protein [Aurantiacibacter rhizosphaerae]|uniref:Tetratricopeptide repeat protein n=1 Tax=Aurantiacibacter rhizosphaerae TaxID=2691582 RepID=A0A844X9M0_9SPHN|nr:tetratricopeptide repeat protein [Aurantiacibacter rhizosphaerae]MWV26646.1 tetratricopeptide repeat protein [Aurantiacibacter rhizosphaerae]